MGLTPAELGGEIVDCRGLDLDAREPPDYAAAKLTQALRNVRNQVLQETPTLIYAFPTRHPKWPWAGQ